MIKQVYIGIFAHPDDESFGPSGSFLQYIQNGADVHLICATTGQRGKNPDSHDDIGAIRIEEWLAAGKMLGAKSQVNLHYHDGELSNSVFHEIADKVQSQVENILSSYKDARLILVTFDQTGISGHIDHIVMSNVTSFVFEKLQPNRPNIQNVHYFCLSCVDAPASNTDFVFMPRGRELNEIDITNDISDVYEQKKQIMRVHTSQREDAESIIARQEKQSVNCECFYMYK
jgi:LmbE family N-acetylglucosaminyl deacetylase